MEYEDTLYSLHKETIRLLKKESIIPCIDGTYITANKAKIAGAGELINLFEGKKLCDFINQPNTKWLTGKFTKDNKVLRELHGFFIDKENGLAVEEISSNDLPRLIRNNINFFDEEIENDWLVDFYMYLETVRGLLSRKEDSSQTLAILPFIKTTDGKFNAPFKSAGRGKPLEQNIYVKPKDANIDNIEGFLFIEDFIVQKCPDFVEALGLKEPDRYALFIKELENTKYDCGDNLHISQIKKALKFLKDGQQENIVDKLKSLLKLKLIDTFRKEHCFVINEIFSIKKTKIYREKDKNAISIKDYFIDAYHDALFLDESFYINHGISSEDLSLLERLGIKNTIYLLDDEKEWEDESDRRVKCSNKGNFRKRLYLEKIDDILGYINNSYTQKASSTMFATKKLQEINKSKEKSRIILDLLKNVEKHLAGQWQPRVMEQDVIYGVSLIIEKLKRGKWLYSSDFKFVKPSEISRCKLNKDIYGQVDENTKIYELLGFKETEEDRQNYLFTSLSKNVKSNDDLIFLYKNIINKLNNEGITIPPLTTINNNQNKLKEIYERWIKLKDKKQTLVREYEKSLYPGWFKREDLELDIDNEIAYNKAWFTLFAIAICQQRGWSSDEKNKNFLEYLKDNNSWFDTMVNTTSESEWMNIIKEYYKSKTKDQEWQEWIKLIPQFFIIRFFMNDYIGLITGLDKRNDKFELDTILRPNTDSSLNGTRYDLPALNRTLRLGLPFIIRELLRFGIIKPNKNIICHAFMPKNTTAEITVENYGGNLQYTSRQIFEGISSKLNKDGYTFDGYYDIPILLFN
jgi:hypothetical protein